MNKHHINPFDRQILIIYLYSDLTYMVTSAECDLDSAILNFARLKKYKYVYEPPKCYVYMGVICVLHVHV